MPLRLPTPLPPGLLAGLAQGPGLLLCLDYDGTLAEITNDPAKAWPREGVREELQRLTRSHNHLAIAVVTGRSLADLKRLLRIETGIFFSGVHGLELDEPGKTAVFSADALACTSELATVRRWLSQNIPGDRGFMIEDKQVALGLHYRRAEAAEAAAMCERLADFVARETPRLKVLRLKMLAEVMPRVASKARALVMLKARMPRSYLTAYFGDDTTDEDALAALAPEDIGILVGSARVSHAIYRVDGPSAVVDELRALVLP
jgi:trehalose 6-phosphate phosphatase